MHRELALAAALWTAAGEAASGQSVEELRPNSEILLAAVGASPPEIGADLILTTLEQPRNAALAKRAELLDVAEALIVRSKYPARIQAAVVAGRSTDSSIGMLTMALDRRIDKRSLTSRFVSLVVREEPHRARQVLDSLAINPLPSLTCNEGYVWASPDEFEAVRSVWKDGFTRRERTEGKDRRFLLDFINRIDHPAQIEPLLAMLVQLSLAQDTLQEVITAVGALLERARVDARTTQTILSPALSQRFHEVWRLAKNEGLTSEPLLTGFAKYLNRVGASGRCADSDVAVRAKVFLTSFNRLWSEAFPDQDSTNASPTVDGMVSKEAKGKAVAQVFWKAGRDKDFAQSLGATWRLLNGSIPPSAIERAEAVDTMLRHFEDWRRNPSDSDDMRDQFSKVCLVYRELIERLPDAKARLNVGQDYVLFLSRSEMLTAEPVLWYLHVQLLVEATRRSELQDVGDLLRRAGHPIMRVQMDLCGRHCRQNEQVSGEIVK